MESSDGFRRRQAITLTPQNRVQITKDLQSAAEETQKQTSTHVKFQRINKINHAILRSRKRQQEFQKTIDEICERKCTFYRMGFKSYEKSRQRKVFGQVLGLASNQMKGTMFVGQLWSNHENTNFMKQNKIHMTKLKLMDKLQEIKKERDCAEDDAVSENEIPSCKSLATIHFPNAQLDRSSANSMKNIEISANLERIRNGLKSLKRDVGKQSFVNQVRYLQRCNEKIERVGKQYFLKMIQIL